jgi:8-oxo-dGTP pyrophosphatase MutT (NUDIX family)
MNYVVGFMFSAHRDQVALIRKLKPAWQFMKLNGIGGKVEKDECFNEAMAREFQEETGYATCIEQWELFCKMSGKNNDDGGRFAIEYFATVGDLSRLTSTTSEHVEIVYVREINLARNDMVENCPWLIAAAMDFLADGRPSLITAEYP